MKSGMIRSILAAVVFVCMISAASAYTVQELGTIPLVAGAEKIAFDQASGIVAAVAKGQRAIALIDPSTGATRSVPLESTPTALAFDPASHRLIAATSDGKLIFIDPRAGSVTGSISYGQKITGLGIRPDNGLLIVGTGFGIAVFDPSTQTIRTEVLLARPVAGLAIDTKHGWLLLLQEGVEGISIHSSETLDYLATFGAGAYYASVDLNPSTGIIIAADAATAGLSVFSSASDTSGRPAVSLLGRIQRSSPVFSVSIDQDLNIAYLAQEQSIGIIRLENPVPWIDSLVPDSARQGDKGVTLSIKGERFVGDSQASFDSKEVRTGFESTEALQAIIPAEQLLRPGTVPVIVTNPPPGGGASNTCSFRIYRPAPVISELQPGTVLKGTSRKIRVRGSNYFNGSVVNLNGENLATRFISSILLEADLTEAHTAKTGEYPVVVVNPSPGGFTSNAKTLAVGDGEGAQLAALSSQQKDKAAQSGSLRGRIVNTNLQPLSGVTISAKGISTITDDNGNFLLENVTAGKRVVLIDGATEKGKTHHYPTIPLTIDIEPGTVTDMPFQIYLHKQKARNFRHIDPQSDIVPMGVDKAEKNERGDWIVTDPELPGFEMRVPKGVKIRGWDNKANTKVSVRTVPPDRLPIKPLPKDAHARTVYMFYFHKVGGGTPDEPIPVKMKNDLGLLPGEKAVIWFFDESPNEGEAPNDWAIAGTGTVTPDGKYIVTDPGVGIPKFCCGALSPGGQSAQTPKSSGDKKKAEKGEPVDVSTGYFIHRKTDLVVPGLMPITVTRSYRNRESGSAVTGAQGLGAFGKGTYFEYDWWLGAYGADGTLNSPNPTLLLLIEPGNYQFRFADPDGDGIFTNDEDPEYRGVTVTYDAVNDRRTLRMRDGRRFTFDYKARMSGELIKIEDRYGNWITFTRRARPVSGDDYGGYIMSIANSEGRTVTFNQTFVGPAVTGIFRTNSIVDDTGRTVTYTYEIDPFSQFTRLKKITYWDGSVLEYEYDSAGRMSAIRNNGRLQVANEYDTDHRVIRQVLENTGVFTFSYNVAGGNVVETTMTEPNGASTTWGFYDYATRSIFHDKYITYETTLDGTTVYEREQGTNLLQSVTDPIGRKTSYTYWPAGQVKTMTDSLNNTSSFEYEGLYSLPTKVTDALGKITTIAYTFDAQQQVTKADITDPLGKVSTINYNANGTVSSVRDPNQNTTSFFYENSGKPAELTKITDPLGNSVTFGYDSQGRRTGMTDAKGRATYLGYDLMDRVIETVDPLSNITQVVYDLHGDLRSVIDAKGRATGFTYDSSGRLATKTDQLSRPETYAYDTSDNMRTRTDRKGQVTTHDYDLMNRLKKVTWHDGSTTQYTYDAGGRLLTITDSVSGTISYEYEGTGCTSGCTGFPDRISKETTPLGVISYTYDKLGRRATMSVAGQQPVYYTYDDAGRLVSIKQKISSIDRIYKFLYDDGGRRTALEYYIGTATTPTMKTAYTYNNAGMVTNIKQLRGASVLENLLYEYDANGNRTKYTRNATQPAPTGAAGTSYDDGNEMLSFTPSGGTARNMAYDANGNLSTVTTSCGVTTYTWNARNQLVVVSGFVLSTYSTCTAVAASFKYDAMGRRIEKTVNGITTKYVYDGLDIIQEKNSAGTVTANYMRTLSIDGPLMRVKGTVIRHYKQDALGSVIQLMDDTGTIKTIYTYDPFGNVTVSGSEPTYDNPFQYTGRENDGTGLYYYRARYYSPMLQRFISEDPIGFAAGDVNLFAYVGNNPVNYQDPHGLIYGAVIAKGLELLGLATEGTPVAGAIVDTLIGAGLSMAGKNELPCEEKLGVPYLLVQGWGGISGLRLGIAIAATSPTAGPVLPLALAFAGGWIIGDAINDLVREMSGESLSDYVAEGLYIVGQRYGRN